MPSKIPFKTAYAERDHVYTEAGTEWEKEYQYEINSYGQKVLVCSGKHNRFEQIQADLEDTKIENILARATAGDTSMLRPDGIYADLTSMPSNLLEARQAMQQLENTWNGLDNEIKKKYNYDLDQFIGQSGSDSWLKDMGIIKEDQQSPIVKDTAEAPATIDAHGEVTADE